MTSLVIGNTSQLAHYFPDDYEKISSRNIDYDYFEHKEYDRIFLCFAEQRTFLENPEERIFSRVNHFYTLSLIEFFKDKCNYIITYGTCELWNNYIGPVDINMSFKYNSTPYILSKERMTLSIHDLNYYNQEKNAIIIHPFNFNSIYRRDGFLFGKIFDSILNKKKIEIGDTYFYRDLIHPKYVVERSILAEEDELVGSGRLTFVNDFIRELYQQNDMKYEDYVTENFSDIPHYNKYTQYLRSKEPKYTNLLKDTLDDIRLQDKIS